MSQLLTCVFAAIGAWCLFSTHGVLWPVPALCLIGAARLARPRAVTSWTVAVFSALLALWSVWAFRRAQEPEGVGIIILGMTPLMQLFAVAVMLVPLLLGQRLHHRPPGLSMRSTPVALDNRRGP